MKNWKLAIGICFGFWVLMFGFTAAAVPQYLNYQGVLRDSAGNLVSGTKAMTFKIFDASTSGTELWTMTSSEVKVNNGLYNVQLGPLGSVDMTSGRRWIEVAVGTDTLSPRLEILAVAYALLAASAESVGGYSVAPSGSGNFIPVATSGKLNASVIPTTGLTADTANYATLSGTATNAGYATLSGTASSATSVKGQVTAEATSGYALFIDGRLGAGGVCVGSGTLRTGGDAFSDPITPASSLTSSSIILVSPGDHSPTYGNPQNMWVRRINATQFRVYASSAVDSYPFNYIIIN